MWLKFQILESHKIWLHGKACTDHAKLLNVFPLRAQHAEMAIAGRKEEVGKW